MQFLIIALICSTLISQSLMDGFSVLLLAALCWNFISSKKRPLFNSGFEKLWPIWLSVLICGLILNAEKPTELLRLVEWKWIAIFYGLLWSFEKFSLTPKQWNFFWSILALSSFYGLVTWYLEYDLVRHEPSMDLGRAGGFFFDPMTFAHVYGQYFCFATGLLLTLWANRPPNRSFINDHFILIYAIILTGLAVLLSFTRGVWVASAVGMLVMSSFIHRRMSITISALIILTPLILFFIWPQFHDRLLYVFNPDKGYDSDRFHLWQANWMIFKDYPIFGAGFGEYKNILPTYFDRLHLPENQFASHAHNQYLHILAGTGLSGFFCYLFFIFYILKRTVENISITKNTHQTYVHGLLIGSIGAQTCFLIGGLTESNFERAKVRLVYLLLSILALSLVKSKHSSSY